MTSDPDIVLVNAKVTTLDRTNPAAEAVAIRDGRIASVGREREVAATTGGETRIIDAGGRRIIPGLSDSHTHLIRCLGWAF
jgi:predicted amidohydrolase YtcJ